MQYANLILALTATLIILATYYFKVGASLFSLDEVLIGFELYILPVLIMIFFVFFILQMLRRK